VGTLAGAGGERAPMRTADAVRAVSSAIAPYIGDTMARAATIAHLKKLGVGETQVRPSEVEALLKQLSNGLNVFVGKVRSAEAVQSARQALAAIRVVE
jgi:hypothetical protein